MCKKNICLKGRIFKTTDGFLSNNKSNKKERRIVVNSVRSDGALCFSKITKCRDKKGDYYISNLILKPKNHSSLSENSYIERHAIFGIKRNNVFYPVYKGDLEGTKDKLTLFERYKQSKELGGKSKKNRCTYKKTLKKWNNFFKNN